MTNKRSNTKKIIVSSYSSFCLIINDKSQMIHLIKLLIITSLLVNTINMNIKSTAKKKFNSKNYNSVFGELSRHKGNVLLNLIEVIDTNLNHNTQVYDIRHLPYKEKNIENYSRIICYDDKDRLHNKPLYLNCKNSDYIFLEYQREYFNLLITKLCYTNRSTNVDYFMNESIKNNSTINNNYIYILSSINTTLIKEIDKEELRESKNEIIICYTNHIDYNNNSFDSNIKINNNTTNSIIHSNSGNIDTRNNKYFNVFIFAIVLGILIKISFRLNHLHKSDTIYSIYINFSFIIVIVQIILLLSSLFIDLFLFNISKITTDRFVLRKYSIFIQSLINVISTLLNSFTLLLLVMISNGYEIFLDKSLYLSSLRNNDEKTHSFMGSSITKLIIFMRLIKDKGYILYIVTYNICHFIFNHLLFNSNILVFEFSLNVKVIMNLMIGILIFLFIAYSSYQTLLEYQKSRIRNYNENQKNRFLNKIIKDEYMIMNNLITYLIFFFIVSLVDLYLNSEVIEHQGINMEELNIYNLLYLFLILFIFNNINNSDTLLKISYINTDFENSNNSDNNDNDNNNDNTKSFQYRKLSVGKFTILSANMSYYKIIIRKTDNDYNFNFNRDNKNKNRSNNSLDRELSDEISINNIIIVNPAIYDNTKSNRRNIFGKYSFFMANQLISNKDINL